MVNCAGRACRWAPWATLLGLLAACGAFPPAGAARVPPAPVLTPALVLNLSGESGARATALVAAADVLYLLEQTSGEVRAFPLHGMPRAYQFSKVLRRKEGDNGLIIGQPIAMALAGTTLYVLDDKDTLWSYDAVSSLRTLVGLRVESRQGALRGISFPAGLLQLDVLDQPAGGGRGRLWAYRRDPHGFTEPPRLLAWGVGLPAGRITLAGPASGGALLIGVGGEPVLTWPGSGRVALRVPASGVGQPSALGTIWTGTALPPAVPASTGPSSTQGGTATRPPTVLVLDGAHGRNVASLVEALREGTGGPLPPVRFRPPPAAAAGWRAVTGDASTGRIYLLDAANHVYSLPMPAAWRS